MCTGEWGGGSFASAGDLAKVAQPLGLAQPRIILVSSRSHVCLLPSLLFFCRECVCMGVRVCGRIKNWRQHVVSVPYDACVLPSKRILHTLPEWHSRWAQPNHASFWLHHACLSPSLLFFCRECVRMGVRVCGRIKEWRQYAVCMLYDACVLPSKRILHRAHVLMRWDKTKQGVRQVCTNTQKVVDDMGGDTEL